MKSLLLCAVAAVPALFLHPAAIHAQAPAHSHTQPAGPISVQNAWARATAGQGGASGAFLTLTTTGAPDRLLSVSTPAARRAELHETKMDGAIMRMLPVAGIDVLAGTPVELKPGGLHIMLMDLPAPLKAGDSFPLTLTFAHAPSVTVTVQVVPPGAAAPHSH